MLFSSPLLLAYPTTVIILASLASAGLLPSTQQQSNNGQHQTITSLQFNRQHQPNQAPNPLLHISSLASQHGPQSQQQAASTITMLQTNSYNNPYTMATHALLLDLRQQLINRAFKFDEHFKSLLKSSKMNLHQMFIDTYGIVYQQNSEIFTSMYQSLEQYYATGQVQLTKSMQEFFVKLYQKIFQAFNLNRIFTPEYMACATEQLEHLKPFKDAPDKLIGEIRHAFVAARTFNQAMNAGIDVIRSIISLGQPLQCTNLINDRLLKRTSAAGPSSNVSVPCIGYCEQVISRCVGRSNLDQLNERWKAYVVLLSELAKKLSIHYNIETIIAPLDVQISEAIMNFQENATNITDQVSRACGPSTGSNLLGSRQPTMRPQQGRLGKRAAPAPALASVLGPQARNRGPGPNSFHHQVSDSMNGDDQLGRQARGQRTKSSGAASAMGSRSSLPLDDSGSGAFDGLQVAASSPTSTLLGLSGDPLAAAAAKKKPIIIDEIRDYMSSTKLFWSALPNAVCTSNGSTGAGASASAMFLGGEFGSQQQQHLQRRLPLSRKPPHCYEELLGLSDMNSDLRYRMEIQQQVNRLVSINAKISDALRGVEIDWTSGPAVAGQQQGPTTAVVPPASGAPSGFSAGGGAQLPRAPSGVFQPSSSAPAAASTSGEDEPEEDDESVESGSGDGPPTKNEADPSTDSADDTSTPDESDYPDGDDTSIESAPTNDDDYGPSSTGTSGTGSSDTDESTTQQTPGDGDASNDHIAAGDDSLNSFTNQPPKVPVNSDISNDLITAPDAQRSGAQVSYAKISIVIFSLDQSMLLTMLLTLASSATILCGI